MFVEERVIEIDPGRKRIQCSSVQRPYVLHQTVGEVCALLERLFVIQMYLTENRDIDVDFREDLFRTGRILGLFRIYLHLSRIVLVRFVFLAQNIEKAFGCRVGRRIHVRDDLSEHIGGEMLADRGDRSEYPEREPRVEL